MEYVETKVLMSSTIVMGTIFELIAKFRETDSVANKKKNRVRPVRDEGSWIQRIHRA